jgi:amphi-Trp domain-containing protein
MATRKKGTRDVEKDYPRHHFIAKLRRLADCLEQGKPFRIQIAGERVVIPAGATIQLEHERAASLEEVEFQLRWSSGSRPPR